MTLIVEMDLHVIPEPTEKDHELLAQREINRKICLELETLKANEGMFKLITLR